MRNETWRDGRQERVLTRFERLEDHLKTAGECEDEMQKLSKEWEEQRAYIVRDAIPSLVGKVR